MLYLKTYIPFGYWIIFHVFLLSADFFFKFNFFEKKYFRNVSLNGKQIGPRFGLPKWRA